MWHRLTDTQFYVHVYCPLESGNRKPSFFGQLCMNCIWCIFFRALKFCSVIVAMNVQCPLCIFYCSVQWMYCAGRVVNKWHKARPHYEVQYGALVTQIRRRFRLGGGASYARTASTCCSIKFGQTQIFRPILEGIEFGQTQIHIFIPTLLIVFIFLVTSLQLYISPCLAFTSAEGNFHKLYV